MKFSIKDFLSKCDQIRRKLWIWSHLLKKSLMENFIFCAVVVVYYAILINFILILQLPTNHSQINQLVWIRCTNKHPLFSRNIQRIFKPINTFHATGLFLYHTLYTSGFLSIPLAPSLSLCWKE